MLFLVPPSLVREQIVSKLNKLGIKLWDGTQYELRAEYSIDMEEHRILQYDSCRGLEGWVVICLDLDQFVKYKESNFQFNSKNKKPR